MRLQGKNIKLGFGLLLIWSIVSAFSRVFTGAAEQGVSPVVLCFYITLISSIFFIVTSLPRAKKILSLSLQNKGYIVGINIATIGCWFFLLYPLKYLEPSIVSTLTLCMTPIATLIIAKLTYKQQRITTIDVATSIGFLVMLGYLITIGFSGKTAVTQIPFMENILSIFSCLVVSISLAYSNIFAKKLSDIGFNPLDTLAIRFILLLMVSGLATWLIYGVAVQVNVITLLSIVFIASISLIIIPQVVYQSAIRELEPLSVAVILPMMPVIAFFMEFFDKRLHPTGYSILGIFIIFIITVTGSIARYKTEKVRLKGI